MIWIFCSVVGMDKNDLVASSWKSKSFHSHCLDFRSKLKSSSKNGLNDCDLVIEWFTRVVERVCLWMRSEEKASSIQIDRNTIWDEIWFRRRIVKDIGNTSNKYIRWKARTDKECYIPCHQIKCFLQSMWSMFEATNIRYQSENITHNRTCFFFNLKCINLYMYWHITSIIYIYLSFKGMS